MTELPRRTPGAPHIPHYRTATASIALLIRVASGTDEWCARDTLGQRRSPQERKVIMDGPWIYASACAIAAVDGAGNLLKVGCPSRMCPPGLLVPLDEHGLITAHTGLIPGDCPFIGYRVVKDPAAKPGPSPR